MISDLYKLREQLEDLNPQQTGGLNAVLSLAGFKVFTRINSVDDWYKITPRIELKAEIGDATGHRIVAAGALRFDYFHFSLAVQCVTRPKNKTADNELHEIYVANVRNALAVIGGNESLKDNINFPNVYIAEVLKDNGTQDYLKESDATEYTTLSYDGIICIRKESWNNN